MHLDKTPKHASVIRVLENKLTAESSIRIPAEIAKTTVKTFKMNTGDLRVAFVEK
jgi:hypothetical protein